MMDAMQEINSRIFWGRAVLNSLLVWILGFFIFMVPGIIASAKMAIELGPKLRDSEEISARISSAMSEMYSSSLWLMGFYAGLFFILIFWRAWVVARRTGERGRINGMLVSSIPVVTSLLFAFSGGIDVYSMFEIFLFLGAGALAGGLSGKAT